MVKPQFALLHPFPAPAFLPPVSDPTSPLAALVFLPILLVLFMFLARPVGQVQVEIGQWSQWGAWSPCSSTCFNVPGVRSRTRTCPTIPPNCEGMNFEAENCAGPEPCQIT